MNRYLVAALVTAVAVAASFALVERFGQASHSSVVLLVAAAVAAAWYGGVRAGLLSTALGALAFVTLFTEPRFGLRVGRADDQAALLSLVVTGLVGCGVRAATRVHRPPNQSVSSFPLPNVWWLACFVVANLVAAGMGQGLKLIPGVSITFWPPAGIFVAALLLTDRARWPWWVAGAGAAELAGNALWFHNPLHLAVLYFAANAAEAMTASLLVTRAVGGASRAVGMHRLETPQNAALFALLAGAVAPLVGATVIAAADAVIGRHPFGTAWVLVWLGDGTGLLLSAPLTLAAAHVWRHRRRVRVRRTVEFAGTCGLTLLLTGLALRGHLPTAYAALPAVVWAAVRFQVRGAWAVLTAVVLTVAVHARSGLGEFAGAPEQMRQQVVALQAFLGVSALTALIVAGLSAQYVRALARLRAANLSLEQRVLARTADLRESEGRFRLAADAVNGIIYEYDFKSGHVARSRGLYEVLGYHTSEVPTTAAWWWEQIHQDDRAVARQSFTEASGDSIRSEYRVRHRDGRWLHVEDRAVLLRDGDGQPAKLVGCTIDVTTRKEAEEQLRLSRERLMATRTHAPVGIVETTLDGGYAAANPEFCRITGYTEAELLTRRVADVTHPDDYPRNRDLYAGLVAGELPAYRLEKRYVRKDGAVAWASVNRTLLREADGTPRCVVGAVLDITEQKRAEDALRAATAELRRTLETAATGLIRCSRELIYRSVNPAYAAIIGRPVDGIVGRPIADAVGPAAFAVIRPYVERVLSGERVEYEAEVPFAAGGTRYIHVVYTPDEDGTGTVVGWVGSVTDITARRRAEEERERVVATLNNLIAAAPLGIVLFDTDMRYRHINGPLAEMNGIPAEAHIGRTVAEVVPDLYGQVGPLFDRVLGRGETVPDVVIEGETPKAPGVRRCWRQSWFPVSGPDGRPSGVGVIVQEITEQRRLEQERENSQRMLFTLVEQCPFGIYIVDDEFRIASVNAGSQDKAFANVRPLIGRPFDEAMRVIWPEPVATDCINIFRRTLATGEPYFSRDFVSPRADIGRTEGYEWEVHRLALPGGRYGAVCYYFDATRLRQTERELREAEGRLRTMADNAQVLIWQTDDSGVTFLNRHYLDFFGLPAEAAGGMGWADFLHPDDGGYLATYRAAYAARRRYEYHARFRRHDGEYRWLQSVGSPLFTPDGAFAGFVGCSLDVTESRRAADGLKDADRKKDEFLATLAHELRNPLAPIQNGVQIIRMSEPSGPVVRTLDTMDRQLGHLVRMIDDLLDVSRITRGKLHLQRERVALSAVVEAAVEATMPLIARSGHELTVRPVPVVWLDGDPTRLSQIISNLLTNAAKYTERGGRITLTAKADGGEVAVSVRDTGIGIPPAMLTRVFEMFSQVDRALEKTTGGLGIGLSLVRGLVEMHGGTISAHSAGEGQGSEFTVRLPATAGTGEGQAMSGTTVTAAGQKLTILVVDDNEDAAESMATMLEMFGHEVRTAFDGEAGVAAAGEFRPQVAFLDIGMPKLNGYAAARRIRSEAWGKGMLLVALTGWGSDDDRRKTEEARFDRHLTKPVNPQALMKLLAEMVPVGA